MPLCLSCGENVNMVELLFNSFTQQDERYCPKCAHGYRADHPDCRPHGKVFDFGVHKEDNKVIDITTSKPSAGTAKCEMCGNITINKIKNAQNVLLCYGCMEEFDQLALPSKREAHYLAGKNGVITINPASHADPLATIKRRWCYKHCALVEESKGRTVPSERNEFWCYDCIEQEEGSVSDWHIRLKIKGKPEAIEFFHWMIRRLDHDWEGGGDFAATEFCENCKGWEWHNPRLKPEHLKKLAKIAGLRKLKVVFWGKAEACAAKLMARRSASMPNMLEGMVD